MGVRQIGWHWRSRRGLDQPKTAAAGSEQTASGFEIRVQTFCGAIRPAQRCRLILVPRANLTRAAFSKRNAEVQEGCAVPEAKNTKNGSAPTDLGRIFRAASGVVESSGLAENRLDLHSEGYSPMSGMSPAIKVSESDALAGIDPNHECSTNRLITVKAAARFLGVSPQTVYRWVERKQIPHLRVMGRNIRFLISDLEPFRALFKQKVENG
jgi:excisionase family DNA binding protein